MLTHLENSLSSLKKLGDYRSFADMADKILKRIINKLMIKPFGRPVHI